MVRPFKLAIVGFLTSTFPHAGGIAIAQPAAASSSAVCMAREDGPQGKKFGIVVPASSQAQMASRGFTLQPCSSAPGQFNSYKVKICHLADKAPQPIQTQFGQRFGATPRELCDLAEAAMQAGG